MGWWVPGQIHPRFGGYQKLDSLDCLGLVGLIEMLTGLVEKKTTASKMFWICHRVHLNCTSELVRDHRPASVRAGYLDTMPPCRQN